MVVIYPLPRKSTHTLSLTDTHTQARDTKHPISDKHVTSHADRRRGPNIHSVSNNGSKGLNITHKSPNLEKETV